MRTPGPAPWTTHRVTHLGKRTGLALVGGAVAVLLAAAAASAPPPTPPDVSFHGLGDPAGGASASVALGISRDGHVAVGYVESTAGTEAAVWRNGTLLTLEGMPGEGRRHTIAHGCSRDGAVVVGSAALGGTTHAVAWRDGRLTQLAGEASGATASDAWGVSADGSTIVGEATIDGGPQAVAWRGDTLRPNLVRLDEDGDSFALRLARAVAADGSAVAGAGGVADADRAFRIAGGRVEVLRTPDGHAKEVLANGISADGTTVVGAMRTSRGSEAFRWRGGAARPLGGLAADHEYFSAAHGTSADGSRVVGSSEGASGGPEAFVWDEVLGMQPLREVLVRQHGLDLTGWTLAAATAISDDGRTIVGYGRNPRGETEGWIARLPAANAGTVAAGSSRRAAQDAPGLTPGGGFAHFEVALQGLRDPTGVAIDGGGNLYVADSGHDRVCVFDRRGALRRCFEEATGQPSSLSRPVAVAVAHDGVLVVLDGGNDRVVTYAADGSPRLAFGGRGSAPGRFVDPRGVATREGRIAVADSGNDRLQVFDERGTFLAALGRTGSGPGELHRPSGVAFDARGGLWVADTGNDRLVRFDGDRRFDGDGRFDGGGVSSVTAGGPGRLPGFLSHPTALVWHAGEVHVVDTGNDRVQVFDDTGRQRLAWGSPAVAPREGSGRLRGPTALAIAASGEWAAVCEPVEDRCQVLAAALPAADGWTPPLPAVSADVGEHLSVDGNLVAVVRPATDEIELRDLDAAGEPRILATAGGHGSAPGKLVLPAGVAVDFARRRLLVSDSGNRRLQQFALPDELLRGVGAPGVPAPQAPFVRAVRADGMLAALRPGEQPALPTDPGALAVGADGSVYLVDEANRLVLVLDERLAPRRVLAAPGAGGRPFMARDVAVDRRSGTVFVLGEDHLGENYLASFDREGRALGSVAVEPRARAVAVSADGSPWIVADPARLLRLGAQGLVAASFGRPGVGRGELHKPRDLGFDGRGHVVVLDWGNRRVLLLAADGTYQGAFGAALHVHPVRVEPPASGAPAEVATPGGAFVVRFAPAPAEIPLNEPFSLWVRVLDGEQRQPLDGDVGLTVDAEMPAHRHGMTTRPEVARNEDGTFTVRGLLLHMPGEWRLHFDVTRDGSTERATAVVLLE